MTLFISSENRHYEISDAYVMALTFIFVYAITKITKDVITRQLNRNRRKAKINELRGGHKLELQLTDNTDLGLTILACINDHDSYIVKDQLIKNLIFSIVKKKVQNESIIITPRMIRFLALRLISNDQTIIVKVGNIISSSSNRARLGTRVISSAFVAFIAALWATFPYAVLIMVISFLETENCGYTCNRHFEPVPKGEPAIVRVERASGNLLIGDNSENQKIELYVPKQESPEVISPRPGEQRVTRNYERSRTQAKQVKFSEFRKTDPELSKFKDLEEPYVPQSTCNLKELNELTNMRID